MEVKVVIGSSAGDEGKGLVSGSLAREAKKEHKKVLTVFYNGTAQRAHSFGNNVEHCMGAGNTDTYYHPMFVVDPITLWLTNSRPIIDPNCRLIIPQDVVNNRRAERNRGKNKHGSCGFGLFAAVSRKNQVYVKEIENLWGLYQHVKEIDQEEWDEVYNLHNFMRAISYIYEHCPIYTFKEIISRYDAIIYEGGQGLLLDQNNKGDFPHLTPSSVGLYNIYDDIKSLKCVPDFYYVSRTYMTRHGAGPMEAECKKEDINPEIIDMVNQPNEWQDSLRFGRINLDSMYERIKKDASLYGGPNNINLVFTQLNYTDNKIETIHGRQEIIKPNFCNKLYVSNDKFYIHEKVD